MHLGAMISAAATVILFFGMEESLYFRSTVEGQELRAVTASQFDNPTTTQTGDKKVDPDSNPSANNSITQSASFPPPSTYIQKLALFVFTPGWVSNKDMFKMMYRPLLIMLHFPCTDWSGFLYGISLSWYNVMNGTASPVLSAPPYNWSAAKVGSAYVAPIIGGIFSMLWSGVVADKFAICLARRNKGVREPEQRLWPLALTAIIATGGLITWGVGAVYGIHWIGLMFGMGMLAFGFMTGGSFAISYNIDCFKELSGETMVSVIIIRNTLLFAFSYGITPWVEKQGLRNCFITASMVALVCTLTFLHMMYFGKRLRRFSKDRYWEYVSTSVAGSH